MPAKNLEQLRENAEEIFKASLKPIEPYQAVRRFVRLEKDRLILGLENQATDTFDLNGFDRILVVGGGKASAPMARALEDLLGKRITAGSINIKDGFTENLTMVEQVCAGHPVPDSRGVNGTRKILDLLEQTGERDLVFSVISGGGSALLPSPAGSISLEDKQTLTQQLLECGASIDEINTVRRHVSRCKGGQMARAAYPATIVNLMLSDVVGDDPGIIASGPFTADASTYAGALNILNRYGVNDMPKAIREHLEGGLGGRFPETPKPGDPVFERVFNLVVASNILACEAAGKMAGELGYNTLILSSMIEGETRDVAKVHVGIAKEIIQSGQPMAAPACLISGGETTVTIRGKGKGGRNQEFGLAAAIDIQDFERPVVFLSGGTDGNDGPTDAAGSLVDNGTVARGEKKELSAVRYLDNNDSYNYLDMTGDLLITGPTRTNVMDVRVVLVAPKD